MTHRLHRMTLQGRMLAWRGYLHCRELLSASEGPEEAFIVLSSHRTGSTLLVDYLSQIPQSRFYGELLHTGECRGPRSPRRGDSLPFLKRLFRTTPGRRVGFKAHLDQLEASGLTLEDLASLRPRTKFLVLYRESLFRQYLSHRRAIVTNLWVRTAEKARPVPPVRIETDRLLDYCDSLRASYEGLLSRLGGKSYWALSYEQLCQLGPEGFAECFAAWSGTPPFSPASRLKKQAKLDPSREVSNWEEAKPWLDHPRTTLRLGEAP
jgi:LPS sulfotransferase NodH